MIACSSVRFRIRVSKFRCKLFNAQVLLCSRTQIWMTRSTLGAPASQSNVSETSEVYIDTVPLYSNRDCVF
ncbi:hypothetical protein BHE74_00024080 [Ensete ventricosum]|nr:hypothetical protein BHE74_00024080 [Ensete ventricosum]